VTFKGRLIFFSRDDHRPSNCCRLPLCRKARKGGTVQNRDYGSAAGCT